MKRGRGARRIMTSRPMPMLAGNWISAGVFVTVYEARRYFAISTHFGLRLSPSSGKRHVYTVSFYLKTEEKARFRTFSFA